MRQVRAFFRRRTWIFQLGTAREGLSRGEDVAGGRCFYVLRWGEISELLLSDGGEAKRRLAWEASRGGTAPMGCLSFDGTSAAGSWYVCVYIPCISMPLPMCMRQRHQLNHILLQVTDKLLKDFFNHPVKLIKNCECIMHEKFDNNRSSTYGDYLPNKNWDVRQTDGQTDRRKRETYYFVL